MSAFLPHLPSGWHVDQAILAEEDRVVMFVVPCRIAAWNPSLTRTELRSIRFGHDSDPDCMIFDETLYGVSEKISNFGII